MDEKTKSRLLERIRREHGRLDETLGRLTPEEMTKPGVGGGPWSVKDTLAHITYWERRPLQVLQAAKRDERLPASAWPLEEDLRAGTDAELEDLENERIYAHYRDVPPTDVLADYRRSYADLLDTLESLDEADFAEESRLAVALDASVWDYFAGNTYEHYAEHEKLIRDWLEKSAQA